MGREREEKGRENERVHKEREDEKREEVGGGESKKSELCREELLGEGQTAPGLESCG